MSICACMNIMHIYQIKYLWPCLVSNMKQIFKSSRYHQCHPFPLSFQQSISSYCGAHPDPFYVTVIQWFISRQCYTQLLRIVTAFIKLNRRVSNIIILFKIRALIFLPTKTALCHIYSLLWRELRVIYLLHYAPDSFAGSIRVIMGIL